MRRKRINIKTKKLEIIIYKYIDVEKHKRFYSKHFSDIKLITFFVSILLLCMCVTYKLNANEQYRIYKSIGNIEPVQIIDEIEAEEKVIPKEHHVTFEVIDDGYNIYSPSSRSKGYRYGPSFIYYDDGSIDAWFSSPGNSSTTWDYIRYRHFDGEDWSDEELVLVPTKGSKDHYSCCDPGVIYFNGYYYLGYTSTTNPKDGGIDNNIFVARSISPNGPFEKWDGEGWGGDPEPIIEYTDETGYWGAGEISFVIVNNTLYCYYTWDNQNGNYTRVAKAKLQDDWPNTLEFIEDGGYSKRDGQDSCDVVYLEEYKMFVAFSTINRFTDYSGIAVFESHDGINFNHSDTIRTNISQYAHNMGISKRIDGHINEDDNLFIGYGYGNSAKIWGKWSCRIHGINLIVYEGFEKKTDKNGEPTYRDYWD